MVGPDYSRPPVKTAGEYKPTTQTEFTESLGENSNKIIDPVKWWESFNDPTLNALLKQAAAQNLSLQQTALKIYQLQAQLGISNATLLPSAALNASYSNSRNSTLQEIINNLSTEKYYSKINAIKNNFEKSKQYPSDNDSMFDLYYNELLNQ